MKMWLKRFMKNLKRDCRNITLHGFVNISESKTVWETTFWLTVEVLCFALCLWLMIIHWLRYQSRPTVTSIKSTAYPISNIPFPAVTVCNSNVVHKRQLEYYENLLQPMQQLRVVFIYIVMCLRLNEGINNSLIQEYFKNLKLLVHLTSADNIKVDKFQQIEQIFQNNDIHMENMMQSVAHKCDEMLDNCTWTGIKYNCSKMFRTVKTGLGFCCSFNYFNDLPEKNVLQQEFKNPVVADGAGMMQGLSLSINIDVDDYVSPVLPFFASFVMVHSIWDYSDLTAFSVSLQPGDFALMQLIPTVFTADENLKSITVSKRNCLFENEHQVGLQEEYSFTNCVVECKENAIYKHCKCVPYFYPGGKRKQCTLLDVPCLNKHAFLYNNIKLGEKDNFSNSTTCNCLPQCQDITYEGYVNNVRSSLPSNWSMIYIYFDHAWCTEYTMSLNLTWDMLLASLGGIFGLCLGGSLISLVELIYYILKSIIETFTKRSKVSNFNLKVFPEKGTTHFINVKPRF